VPELVANGVRLVYQDQGDGQPVVLVCGTGQPALSWQLAIAPRLVAAGHRVVTFDNRGFPPSESPPPPYRTSDLVDDTVDLIGQLDLAPCAVAGWSLGAFVTQELALARPDLVGRAVMMGTIGRASPVLRAWAEVNAEMAASGIELPARYEAVKSVIELLGPERQRDGSTVAAWIELMEAGPRWRGPGAAGQYLADCDYDRRLDALAGITVPSLVIGFEHDLLTPTGHCREVAEAIPGARYVEIPGCGHLGPLEDPDAVLSHVIPFLGGH
jgi:thioesterase CepJ